MVRVIDGQHQSLGGAAGGWPIDSDGIRQYDVVAADHARIP
jgi:hypothetical protein